MRQRDLFELYEVKVRDNLAQPRTYLVWAHRASDALGAVERIVAAEQGNRFVAAVLGIDTLRTPDTDTADYAETVWVGGDRTEWPE